MTSIIMPLMIWATHVLQWRNNGKRACEGKQIPKITSQFGLQSATRLHEAGIASIADQNAAVNTFPGLVHTARHTMGVSNARVSDLLQRRAAEGGTDDWGEVVTR